VAAKRQNGRIRQAELNNAKKKCGKTPILSGVNLSLRDAEPKMNKIQ
jgi:predicted transcriptional regulator